MRKCQGAGYQSILSERIFKSVYKLCLLKLREAFKFRVSLPLDKCENVIFSHLFLPARNLYQAKSQLSSQLSLESFFPSSVAMAHVRKCMLLWFGFSLTPPKIFSFTHKHIETFHDGQHWAKSLSEMKSMQRLHENREREIQSVGGEGIGKHFLYTRQLWK